jgi:neutral ceramidase
MAPRKPRTTRPSRRAVFLLGWTVLSLLGLVIPADAGWKAGTAKVVITPKQSMWMAGYGARDKPSEGVLHALWAKALILEDPSGQKAALVTMDLCGIDRGLSIEVREALKARYGLDRSHVVLASSHTHTGPVVRENLITMYPLDEEQERRVRDYAAFLKDALIDVVGRALRATERAELAWATGRADFAVNRRSNKEADVPKLREQLALEGPNDFDVPMLSVSRADGTLKAVVCGYSCHCTVLSFYKFSGDYAGFAQIALERAHPGAQAMFVAGCGADQNPLPRRSVEQAEDYGNQLAQSVERALAGPLSSVSGSLAAAYEEIDLGFGELPTRTQLEADAQAKTFSFANRAKYLLKRLDTEGSLPRTYPYPVQVWRLGDDLTWVLLGGEVVVDYSLRIKRNLGSSRTWVSSYCNDVMAYIPSLRVLKEGGYEGATSMIPYGQPAVWGDGIEEDIMAAVRKLAQATRKP